MCRDSQSNISSGDFLRTLVVALKSIFLFADADQYELQAASVSSPMKSPHRYSPSVYSHQVPAYSS